MISLKKTILKKPYVFYGLDLYLLNILVWLYYVALQFFTLHQSLGDACIQAVSKGLWTLMSIPKCFSKTE